MKMVAALALQDAVPMVRVELSCRSDSPSRLYLEPILYPLVEHAIQSLSMCYYSFGVWRRFQGARALCSFFGGVLEYWNTGLVGGWWHWRQMS